MTTPTKDEARAALLRAIADEDSENWSSDIPRALDTLEAAIIAERDAELARATGEASFSLRTLDEIAKLPDGWDSYGSRSPTPQAIETVRELLTRSQPCPVSGGGVQLDYGDWSVEVGPDGRILQEDVAIPRATGEASRSWRCFHCDEVFDDETKARAHFGATDLAQPACYIGAVDVRAMEQELARYRAEDSDLDRRYHAMQADHATALRREEEKGYARGLDDGYKERDAALAEVTRLTAAAQATAATHPEAVREPGIDTAWPVADVLDKLAEAADILLDRKDYDGHGWELIHTARAKAREYAAALRARRVEKGGR
jgi:hypothetical protein